MHVNRLFFFISHVRLSPQKDDPKNVDIHVSAFARARRALLSNFPFLPTFSLKRWVNPKYS